MKRIMNKIKEKGAVICALLLCITSIAAMAGCGKMPSSFVISDKIKVVCTTFPQYDWVRQILGENGDEFEIKLLTDNGVDMHSYQRPRRILRQWLPVMYWYTQAEHLKTG